MRRWPAVLARLAAALFLALAALPAGAQDRGAHDRGGQSWGGQSWGGQSRGGQDGGGHEPGRFDFYVLSLSWSPTYCEDQGAKAGNDPQCGRVRPYAFVVHGLWPQFERGWPESCQRPAPYVPNRLVDSMRDLMPSRRLVIHEWKTHGTCSGLSADAYFDQVRAARAKVEIPATFVRLDDYRMVSPAEVEAAFRAANPGLGPDMIAVECDRRRLKEVRICMGRDLAFQACPQVDRGACRLPRMVMPPVRGAR